MAVRAVVAGLALAIAIPVSGAAAQDAPLGDVADGNRSDHVHRIPILDENGTAIHPDDRVPMPFSPRQSCQECHDYDTIAGGWHFNANDPLAPAGRRGEPWILADHLSATQAPLSYRGWEGAAAPEDFGLTPFLFTERFGRHFNGGGAGEVDTDEPVETFLRWRVSGKAEINCLSCHATGTEHDQAEYERQIRRQNFRWAAAATSGFATVTGAARGMPDTYDVYTGNTPDLAGPVPPSIEYDQSRFDGQSRVLFEMTGTPQSERCYFCHSSRYGGQDRMPTWTVDQDVHLAAGMTCVDCHRNDIDHSITRGYEWEDLASAFSCAGCHLRDESSEIPMSGSYGAPTPRHRGLPPIHFEKLACTACHSGPWPTDTARVVKTSRAHALGTETVKRSEDAAPLIYSPAFVRDDDGKISPHRVLWPSYWGYLTDDRIEPAPLDEVRRIVLDTVTDVSARESPNVWALLAGRWPRFSEAQVERILTEVGDLAPDAGTPVYVGGGRIFSSEGERGLVDREHDAARPYTWAFGHDVRPAEQSLGIRGCGDCHAVDSAFTFGEVAAPSPFLFAEGPTVAMTELQGAGAIYTRVFAMSFLFRPVLKLVMFACCGILAMLILMFALRGLQGIVETLAPRRI